MSARTSLMSMLREPSKRDELVRFSSILATMLFISSNGFARPLQSFGEHGKAHVDARHGALRLRHQRSGLHLIPGRAAAENNNDETQINVILD